MLESKFREIASRSHIRITSDMPVPAQALQDHLVVANKIILGRDLILATNASAPEGRSRLDYVAEELHRTLRGRNILAIGYSGRNFAGRYPYESESGSDFRNAKEGIETAILQFQPNNIKYLHEVEDKTEVIAQAQAIFVAAGNTSGHTANLLGQRNFDGSPIDIVSGSNTEALQYLIRLKTAYGTPFVGVSAGQMIAAGSGIPHIDPPAHIHIERHPITKQVFFSLPFTGLNLLQNLGLAIQPHADLDKLTNYGDETQLQRLQQIVERNPWLTILATENNTALVVKGPNMTLVGDKTARAFIVHFDIKEKAVISTPIQIGAPEADLSYFLDTDLKLSPNARFAKKSVSR